MAILAVQENTLGEVHPLVELGDLLSQRINLGLKLGIVCRLDVTPEPVGESLTDGAYGEEEQRPPSKDKCDCQYAFHVHSVFVSGPNIEPAC